jgi:N utilization substance protein A
MNAEFFDAIAQIEKEKGIPREYMYEKITQAVTTALKRDITSGENVVLELDEDAKEIRVVQCKTVADSVEDASLEISLEDAREHDAAINVGDVLRQPIHTKDFGRIAAQTAKQVIIQGIREAERGIIFQHYSSKEHEVLTAVVLRLDPRNGNAILDMGGAERNEIMLPFGEQVKNEPLREGDHIKVYVVEVRKSAKGPQVLISRTHPGLVKRLFELEVPELQDGTIEIKAITREAGSRTKMAVLSYDENVDPIGACVGSRGMRVASVVSELHGEKIDIIPYSEDEISFVKSALAPATVISVDLLPGDVRACRAVVPDDQLSLAIGKDGQNARLAARLTGIKIDIKPISALTDE